MVVVQVRFESSVHVRHCGSVAVPGESAVLHGYRESRAAKVREAWDAGNHPDIMRETAIGLLNAVMGT